MFITVKSVMNIQHAVIDRYLASPNYVVAVSANVSGGGVTVSKKTVYRGSTVIITVTPEEGKALSKLTVTDDEGEAVTVKKLYGNKYSFRVLSGDVEIHAEFTEITND